MNSESNQSLDRVLESAVIVSWADLMKDATAGLLHLEYAVAPDRSLEYLKLWSSATRGHWLLACEYWMSSSAFHNQGMHFESGFRSDDLGRTLELIMQHQRSFTSPVDGARTGLLQVQSPTAAEGAAATVSVKEAFNRIHALAAAPAMA